MKREWLPGINHIEFWVSDLKASTKFYKSLFHIIGWKELNDHAYSSGSTEIYFKEVNSVFSEALGPRHICFQAVTRTMVEDVEAFLRQHNSLIIRGPIEDNNYSAGYYTIDFRDPDGYVLEVAYTPNMTL